MKRDISVFVGSLAFMALLVLGQARWIAATETPPGAGEEEKKGAEKLKVLKRELLREAELERVHNEVYEKVGEERWEYDVKPSFLQAITWMTIQETGDPLPTEKQILEWVRSHPLEAQELMRAHGARFERVPPEPREEGIVPAPPG